MEFIRNLRIKHKIGLLLVLNIIAMGIIGLTGFKALNTLVSNTLEMHQQHYMPYTEMADLRSDFLQIRIKLREAYMAPQAELVDMRLNQAMAFVSSAEKNMQAFAQHIMKNGNGRSITAINELKVLFGEFKQVGGGIAKALQQNDKNTAFSMLMGVCTIKSEKILLLLAELNEQSRKDIEALAYTNEQITKQAVINLMLVIAIAALLAIALTLFLSSIISKPLSALTRGAERMAAGDTTFVMDIHTKDESGVLASSFNSMVKSVHDIMQKSEQENIYLQSKVHEMLTAMEQFAAGDLTVYLKNDRDDEIGKLFIGFNHAVENMKELIGRVAESASYAIDASSQISSATEQLAAGAQQQSSQSTDVAAAMEEMTSTITDNARNSVRAAESARQNTSVAMQGSSVVEQTVEMMRTIAGTVQNAAGTVQRLGEASTQIGEIAGVINDIADQTNLLALNAAIEAARAGEHGRGFAVVADEVRKLAERTSQATKQIAQTIRGIQTETEQAVSMMEQSNRQVIEGIELADKAGTALGQITESATEVVTLINQIATASDQQSSTSTEIARNIESISHVSAESARSISDIARTVTELNSVNQEIGELLATFLVNESDMLLSSKKKEKKKMPTQLIRSTARILPFNN